MSGYLFPLFFTLTDAAASLSTSQAHIPPNISSQYDGLKLPSCSALLLAFHIIKGFQNLHLTSSRKCQVNDYRVFPKTRPQALKHSLQDTGVNGPIIRLFKPFPSRSTADFKNTAEAHPQVDQNHKLIETVSRVPQRFLKFLEMVHQVP